MQDLKDSTLSLFFTGGVSLETWQRVRNLDREAKRYREFAKHFKKINFFTYGSNADLQFQNHFGANVAIFPKKYQIPSKLYAFLLPWLYVKELRQTSIFKTNQMNGSWAAVIAKKLYGGKLVIRCGLEWLRFSRFKKRSALMLKVIFFLEKISYRAADLILLPTQEDKDFVVKTFGTDPAKIMILPNHIDTHFFKPSEAAKIPGRIITVCRLEPQKNLAALIEALVGLVGVTLVVLGDGSERQHLEALAKEKNVRVEFKGNLTQDQLPSELQKSQIFVLPSLYEGSPKALLEAMSTGLACIGTDVPGINNVILHGQNGYLCKTDSASIGQAISAVLADVPLQESLASQARKTIEEQFSFEKICQQELNLLRSLI